MRVRGRVARGRVLLATRSSGASLAELALVLGLGAAVAAVAIPATASTVDAQRAEHAAAFLASRLLAVRQQASTRSAEVALVFDLRGTRWAFRVCIDGNANGVRRTDIQSNRDVCVDGPYDLGDMFPGVSIASDAAVPDPDGGAGSTDPLRLGKSNMASFSPAGTGTAGSVFLRSTRGVQLVVRVTGATGRVRVLRFDTGTRAWRGL